MLSLAQKSSHFESPGHFRHHRSAEQRLPLEAEGRIAPGAKGTTITVILHLTTHQSDSNSFKSILFTLLSLPLPHNTHQSESNSFKAILFSLRSLPLPHNTHQSESNSFKAILFSLRSLPLCHNTHQPDSNSDMTSFSLFSRFLCLTTHINLNLTPLQLSFLFSLTFYSSQHTSI